MARVTSEMGAAWVKEAVLVLDGAAPSRHFWSRWMDRALAPHATQMTERPAPIPANDVTPDEDDEPGTSPHISDDGMNEGGAAPHPVRFD